MKQVFLSGNLTRDAEMRRTQSGDPVLSFSIAVNDNRTKQPVFFDCSLWGKRGDAIAGYLVKGGKVSVVGDLGLREHNGKTYLTVNVSEVTLMGSPQQRQDDGQQRARDSYSAQLAQQPRGKPPTKAYGHPDDLDDGDSIPF